MKRINFTKSLKADSEIQYSDVENLFSEIITAFNSYYDVEVDDELHIVVSPRSINYLPDIAVKTVYNDIDDCYYFYPSISFPTLDSAELEFSDSIQSKLNRWAKIGKAVTLLCKFVLPASKLVKDES